MISTPLKLRFAVMFAMVTLASTGAFAAKGPMLSTPIPQDGDYVAKGPGVPLPYPPGGGEVA